MTTVYCWFDWDDNTTTVNSINIIKEPRKPWMQYTIGERIRANLPQFGLWNGVIVEMNESRKYLIQKMNARQKASVPAIAVQNVDKSSGSEPQKRNRCTKDDASDGDSGSENDDNFDKGKKKSTKKVTSKKRTSKETASHEMEKKKKKLEDAMKLDAKTKQLEAIISERRQKDVPKENHLMITSDVQPIQPDAQPIQSEDVQPIQPEDVQPIQPEDVQPIQPEDVQQPSHLHVRPTQETSSVDYNRTEHQMSPYWPRNHYDSSPYSAFHRYSYVGDMMSTQHPQTSAMPIHDFHLLGSQKDTQEQCARLELQNEQLYNENKDLRKENEELRQQLQEARCGQPDDIVTPKKVEFLKQLVSSFEKKALTSQTKRKVLQPTPLRLTYSPHSKPEEEAESEVLPSLSGLMDEPSRNLEDVSPGQRTCHWEESVTSSGVRKVRLVPNIEVYVSQAQLSQIQHVGGSNPRKMTISLMDILFTREQLAKSSARGSKKAHNAKIDTVQLPPTAALAIKQFVLMQFKRSDGTPCLEDSVFNNVINSKCATARRALYKNKS